MADKQQQRFTKVLEAAVGQLHTLWGLASSRSYDRTIKHLWGDFLTLVETTLAKAHKTELDLRIAELRDCEQAAGKVLGYPWFKDDPDNFPNATEADGVCIGEHIGATIVNELAAEYEATKREAKELRQETEKYLTTLRSIANGDAGGFADEVAAAVLPNEDNV